MTYKICHKFLLPHSLFILPVIILVWFSKTTTTTSLGHQLEAGAANHKCTYKERHALLGFKAHLQDPDGHLSTWTDEEEEEENDCCKWSGVACNNQKGHVTMLDLPGYYLGGEISVSLLNLTYLNYLHLSFNSFNGTIPRFIGSMSRLRYLDLRYNAFNGTIPTFIGSMTKLRYLKLGGNSFYGIIPESIGSLAKLRHLDLFGNSFNGVLPRSISSLVELRYLDVSSNSFNGITPRSIGSLAKLEYLQLSGNSFNGNILASIGTLTKLQYLYLSSNLYNGTIPRSIGSLTKLKELSLSYNYRIEGTIPPELRNLTNLRYLSLAYLESCTFENLDWLSHLSRLEYLDLNGNSFAKVDHWVNVILSLHKLSELSLYGCDLSQVMHPYSPSVNSSSSSIAYLVLGNNNLNSSMYQWLFQLTSNRLVNLDLSNNMLDGIPKYLGSLCSLASLSFVNNSVVVNFPDFLSNLSGCTSNTLQELDASYSQFTGSLSEKIQKFSSLQFLYLSIVI